jgi:MYXO-CTERM domain-containing protein
LPADTLALAFAASIYPPAVAAVIALGRGPRLRSRVFAFVAAAFLTTYLVGAVILLLFEEIGATSSSDISLSAGVNIALGVLLLALAVRLQRRRPDPDAPSKPSSGTSKIDRYLQNPRLAALLGVTLYIAPSPIYIGAVKSIADAKISRGSELLDLVAVVAVMLWLIEVPMLILLLLPARAERALDSTNRWFAANGRTVAIVAAVAVGAYLIIKGLVHLPG